MFKKVPQYRLQGYTDAWELRKLGEISTHRGGTAIENHFSEDGKYKVISIGSYGLDNKYIDQKIRAVENEVTRSKVVNKNELTMVLNDKTANGNIIGRCLLIEADDEFVINQRTEIISFNSVIYPKFAYVVLNGVFREQVKKIVQGGTQIYVNYSSVEQLYLSLPSHPEQEAIGTFFSTLDQQITLHQRKLDKLKSVKQAYLSEMFPAEGERMPKRRFPGFTDDWELRKLVNEVLFVGTGKSKFSALEFGEFEILGSTSVIGYDNSYDYEGDFILTARVGANAGELYRHSGKVKISDNTVFIQGDGLDFIFYILQHFDIKKLSFGTGQPLVKASELKELKILMPVSVKERNHVGTFFSTLDQHITLHQRKS